MAAQAHGGQAHGGQAHGGRGIRVSWGDVALVDGVRTPFVDYNGDLAPVTPTDMGIKAGREVLRRSKLPADEIGTVICGSVAPGSFDAFLLPRHIGLYCGAPVEAPASLVQRICGTGIELLAQAADAVTFERAELALCVGAESMTRNPVCSFTMRGGFRMGQADFQDFLWAANLDPAPNARMGDTAENLARRYQIGRDEVDAFAAQSFARAVAAQQRGFLDGEIVAVENETFELEGYNPRAIRLKSRDARIERDSHIRPSSVEALAKIRPAFGGVQTGGNSSAIVDGAAAALVASGRYARAHGKRPLAFLRSAATIGVPPEIMGIGPAPAIRAVCEEAGLPIDAIDRIEINEAFGAQIMACNRELGLDEAKVNVNGGAIAIGHPLAATGLRITMTLARTLAEENLRYGIASACIGGGQGIAVLIENPQFAGN